MELGGLTKRQQEIFDFIRRYASKYGYPPTVREIGKAVGLASSSTVHAHLANLEKYGVLRRNPTKPRAMEVLIDRAKRAISAEAAIPLLGQVAAGEPLLAEENVEEYVAVPPLAGGDEGQYVLRVKGDSMRDAGILEGDFVVVRRQDSAQDGDIVVALLGDEATVKRFVKTGDEVRLQPEHPTMEPIAVTSDKPLAILGKVVAVFRKIP